MRKCMGWYEYNLTLRLGYNSYSVNEAQANSQWAEPVSFFNVKHLDARSNHWALRGYKVYKQCVTQKATNIGYGILQFDDISEAAQTVVTCLWPHNTCRYFYRK